MRPIQANIGETINQIERNDFRYREEAREVESYRERKKRRKTYHTDGERILIYGGEDYSVYLGCINCDKFDKESIWDYTSPYGSPFSKNSITNKHGEYGGEYGKYSPFNKFSKYPPKLVDAKGNFYGYFTADRFFKDRRVTPGILFIINNWERVSDNPISTYIELFEER
ncbi:MULTISPECIES: hypothetical protein [Flavobacterium]|uniref:Uncharacterized protein n=1 Tax=Flavobacterium keumense TaxID=1306518 RepID=A0ABY8N5C0_9FLAO|nr:MULTISPECIES: hypothetical protein [Flavobacterium]WGK93821.1 hypothetical protein MG292_06880 [Flavobacterium keumense]